MSIKIDKISICFIAFMPKTLRCARQVLELEKWTFSCIFPSFFFLFILNLAKNFTLFEFCNFCLFWITLIICLFNTRARDREAYRKIFHSRSGNPDRDQTENLRFEISWSRPRKCLGLDQEFWNLQFDFQISKTEAF